MENRYTEAELEQITELSALFFTMREIDTILGKVPLSEQEYAYEKGRLMTEAAVRRSMISLAKQGSGPAQIEVQKLADRLRMEDQE